MAMDPDSVLFEAVRHGDASQVETALQQFADPNAIDLDNDDQTPLIITALLGHPNILSVLLDHGAFVNNSSRYGETALHCAVAKGNYECAKALLDAGAVVNTQAIIHSPLTAAVAAGHLDCVKLLLNWGADVNQGEVVKFAVLNNHLEILELFTHLPHSGCIVNKPAADGFPPLHVTAVSYNSRAMQMLISGGANIDGMDRYGSRPLHLAASANRPENVACLLENGAEVNALDSTYGVLSACHYAAQLPDTKCLQLLVQSGCNINLRDKDGLTPLMAAISARQEGCCFLLIEENCDIFKCGRLQSFNITLTCPISPMEYACRSRLYLLCQVLFLIGSTRDWARKSLEHAHHVLGSHSNNPEKSVKVSEFIAWMQQELANVPSLLNLCRYSLRKHIGACQSKGHVFSQLVRKLRLPALVTNQILAKDLASSGQYIAESTDHKSTSSLTSRCVNRETILSYYAPNRWINHDSNIYAE